MGVVFFCNHAVPSEKSTIGSHGGEAIAPLNHLNIRPISQELRSEVCRVTAEPLRCALAILRLKGLPILVGDVYMWDTEELSDRNINILRQLYIYIYNKGYREATMFHHRRF